MKLKPGGSFGGAGTGQVPTSHRQMRNRKQAGNTPGQGQKAGGFTRAEARGDGQRQVGSIPGKQSGKKCWRLRHESKDNLAKSEWSEAAYIGDGEQVRAAGESC